MLKGLVGLVTLISMIVFFGSMLILIKNFFGVFGVIALTSFTASAILLISIKYDLW